MPYHRAILALALCLSLAAADGFTPVDINGSFATRDDAGSPLGWTLPPEASLATPTGAGPVTIELREPGRAWLSRRVNLDPTWKAMRFSGQLQCRTLGPIAKDQPWQGALLRFKFLKAGGADLGPWQYPMLRKDCGWTPLEATAAIPEGAIALMLTPGLADCSGTVEIKELQLGVSTTALPAAAP
jgi:hypothetical protein